LGGLEQLERMKRQTDMIEIEAINLKTKPFFRFTILLPPFSPHPSPLPVGEREEVRGYAQGAKRIANNVQNGFVLNFGFGSLRFICYLPAPHRSGAGVLALNHVRFRAWSLVLILSLCAMLSALCFLT
jgi:hypothetical protein